MTDIIIRYIAALQFNLYRLEIEGAIKCGLLGTEIPY